METYLLCLADRLSRGCDISRTSGHLLILWHSNLSKDLIVDFISLILSLTITHCIHSIIHHFTLNVHFFSLFSKLFHDLVHFLRIHVSIDFGHDWVDTLETVKHRSINLRCSKLLLYSFKLTRHRVKHIYLLSRSDQILGHDFCRTLQGKIKPTTKNSHVGFSLPNFLSLSAS